jgi:hypothetical protein
MFIMFFFVVFPFSLCSIAGFVACKVGGIYKDKQQENESITHAISAATSRVARVTMNDPERQQPDHIYHG